MLYYLAKLWVPHLGALNVFTYLTVRAGFAAVTGFVFCLLVGPWLIRKLTELKIGQHIKKEHVADLHKLHQGKAGTPTMGGVMMLFGTLLSMMLWGVLSNRLLWAALMVYLLLGAVGFLDDYIKLKRRHNDGLSARAKLAGQFAAGLFLGLYLMAFPVTTNPGAFKARDLVNPMALTRALAAAGDEAEGLGAVWQSFDEETRAALTGIAARPNSVMPDRALLLGGLNAALAEDHLMPAAFPEAVRLLNKEGAKLQAGKHVHGGAEAVRLNRLVLEAAMPEHFVARPSNLHNKVGVPGLKDVFIPFGPFYILFVILIIICVSNAVNLTDGLDGLAAGVSVISIMAYAAIAYVVSRSDWSEYLYLTHVPEASELFVFGGALLGTGLGFLWFNGHPAEVFMGDTGSLSLGGAIAAMAILTKQELLLPIVGGLFVLEAGSVVLQVASYKLTGKRIFRMAPLHHHFELLGWAETKVTLRFWIVAVLFAMLSLATLKLR